MLPPRASSRARARCGAGFSLIELLAVLAIVVILAAISMMSFAGSSSSVGIDSGAGILQAALDNARTQAVALNTSVEVRIYQRAPLSGGPAVYNAIQPHELNSGGSPIPLMQLVALPSGVVIDSTATHSPLIALNTETATPDTSDRFLNAQTKVFHFLSNGATDLNPATNWFLTIRAATASDPNNFPKNYATVTVNPVTGLVQVYRP